MDAATTSNLPIEKATISGAALSSLLNHLNTTATTTTGLLYGTLTLLTPTALSDDPPSLTPPPSSLIATISSFSPSPTTTHNRPIIGTFSARRLAPSRPSLLDHSLSQSQTLTLTTSSIFLLLTTPPANQTLIHTHDYRLYYFHPTTVTFIPISLEIVNIGPGFRAQYGVFSPNSRLPWLPCVAHVGSPMREDGNSGSNNNGKSLSEMKREGSDQKELSSYVGDGYEIGSLTSLVGSDAVGYMSGVEDLYENMLTKLQSLARLVEASSAHVLDLENHNMKLRRRVAGIE